MMSIMVDTLDITEKLSRCGLNEVQAKVYLALFNAGASSVVELNRITGIPRTTLYRELDILIKAQLVHLNIEVYGKIYEASEPENLKLLLMEKERQLSELEVGVDSLIEMLKSPTSNLPATQVKYYNGIDGSKQLIWNSLRAKNEIFGYSVFGRRGLVGDKFSDEYIIEFNRRRLTDKVLVNKSDRKKVLAVLQGQHHLRINNVRLLDGKHSPIVGDTYIYNDVYALNLWNDNEVIGVEIINSTLAEMQRALFQSLWNTSKPLSK